MSKPFEFKNFVVHQDQCAMKIGTDGVLLGAWSPIHHNPFSILDIGSGTGILALMLAQRSTAQVIEAIEIDEAAYEQCVFNFEQSPWNDRLFCFHASIQEFVAEMDDQYDLIVCNPPFYQEHYKSNDDQRDLARFQDAMPFEHLLYSVSQLLNDNGLFSVIIPRSEEDHFIQIASQFQLFPTKVNRVKGTPSSEPKRCLMEFSFTVSQPEMSELVIETARHQYTSEYIDLTKDFYLKM